MRRIGFLGLTFLALVALAAAAPERSANPKGKQAREESPKLADCKETIAAVGVALDATKVSATNALALVNALPASATKTATKELAQTVKNQNAAIADLRKAVAELRRIVARLDAGAND